MEPKILEERFLAALKALVNPDGLKFLVAFSGGLDSTALLALATASLGQERILAAHLDHNLRPQSGQEAMEAQAGATALGTPIKIGQAQVRELAKKRGRGLEEAARVARYDFLGQTLTEWGGDYILTGHQANDQAETILLKIIRGGGPSALTGIRPRQGRVLRPLLGFSREELAGLIYARGLDFIQDPSNDDLGFRRNHLRLKIWPELLNHNPALVGALGRTAQLALAEEEFWEDRVAQLALNLAEPQPGGRIRVLAARLGELALAEKRRLALFLLRQTQIPGPAGGEPVPMAGVTRLLEFLGENRANGQGVDLPGGRRVERRGLYLYIGPSSRLATSSGSE
ncbi:MAG: tRNA lysidine(34) synthetase TilS [Deltaproteobacteria bacterium]|jgi:tRNA(Ile)-lysidine synthase|nr:tRNA lysidine(34) synthetase TilS [Deltaproteobacteria bacterium]